MSNPNTLYPSPLLPAAPTGNRNSRPLYWPGGYGNLVAVGNLGGGTLTLKWAPRWANSTDASAYINHGSTLIAEGDDFFHAAAGFLYLALTGATNDNVAASIETSRYEDRIVAKVASEDLVA